MFFKNILIAIKHNDLFSFEVAKEIQIYLNSLGVKSHILSNQIRGASLPVDLESSDLVLVLGGDGTILSVARKLGFPKIPFLGLNLGRVGFMAEIELAEWQKSLLAILQGDYVLSPRLGLSYEIEAEKLEEKGFALNDLVIHRSGLARLLEIEIELQDKKIKVRADGVILATPTGSTAYNISAGGPILSPDLPGFIINWICPFLHNTPPLVLFRETEIKIKILSKEAESMLTIDGQRGISLNPNMCLKVKTKDNLLTLLQKKNNNYLEKLSQKGFYSL